MKIVIQCCATKYRAAGSFTSEGRRVKFVADPKLYPPTSTDVGFRPDDRMPSSSMTWREHLLSYNRQGDNPDRLLQAGKLYRPPAYRKLDSIEAEDLYILSAGWGLVRSAFLLPDYDITYSGSAEPWKRRTKKADTKKKDFKDFSQLTQACVGRDETVYFFGGKDYLPLYYRLMEGVVARKVIYFKSDKIPRDTAFDYIPYECRGSTNWHYSCVTDFLANKIER